MRSCAQTSLMFSLDLGCWAASCLLSKGQEMNTMGVYGPLGIPISCFLAYIHTHGCVIHCTVFVEQLKCVHSNVAKVREKKSKIFCVHVS